MAAPTRRFGPAIMLSQLGVNMAVLTQLQLLLALRLNTIAGSGATSAFGVVTGFGALCATVSGPIVGRISDRTRTRLGRRRTWMLTGSVALALAMAAMTVTTAVWQVVLLWCLAQAAANFQYAANNAIVADQIPPQRRGGVSGLVGLATAIGPIAGVVLANAFPAGGSGQWLIVAVTSLVATLAAVLLFRDPRDTSPKPPLDLRTVLTTFWFNPRRHPALGWAWLVRFLIMCAYSATSYNAFFLMQRLGFGAAEVGPVLLKAGLVSVGSIAVASVVAGYLSDAVKRQRPFVIFAGVLGALSLVLMAGAGSVATLFAAVSLGGIGTGTFLAVDLALCVRVLPDTENAGRNLAIITIAGTLPQSLVPFVAPVLLSAGGFPALYLTLGVLALLGAVAILRVPEMR
ncbi:Na+/melibiose symporter [Amycolatopsis saalfeldensis]|uniref:Na+/melibiose symporter n=2 Tax=Amycolatopsis saalfeldensis TaxID=394193 RepID=A0A1H8XGN2_9PSEU|nr:Na+/melibiose symporter [Amycolatopsis saalfeldensis]